MKIQWFDVLRDVAIIWTLWFIGQLLGSLCLLLPLFNGANVFKAAAIANRAALMIGFTISGCYARRSKLDRLTHLAVVALIFWIVCIPNVFLVPQFTIKSWTTSFWQIALLMFMGGGLSLALAPPVLSKNSSCGK